MSELSFNLESLFLQNSDLWGQKEAVATQKIMDAHARGHQRTGQEPAQWNGHQDGHTIPAALTKGLAGPRERLSLATPCNSLVRLCLL